MSSLERVLRLLLRTVRIGDLAEVRHPASELVEPGRRRFVDELLRGLGERLGVRTVRRRVQTHVIARDHARLVRGGDLRHVLRAGPRHRRGGRRLVQTTACASHAAGGGGAARITVARRTHRRRIGLRVEAGSATVHRQRQLGDLAMVERVDVECRHVVERGGQRCQRAAASSMCPTRSIPLILPKGCDSHSVRATCCASR